MKCNKCGNDLKNTDKFCKKCGEKIEKAEEKVALEQKMQPKSENVGLGILGAILGSCAGVVAIIAFDYIGFIASLAGLIMGLCTIALYKKFAGSISIKGIIISIIIMILMTFLAVRLAYVIQLLKYADKEGIPTSFSHVFKNTEKILKAFNVMNKYYVTLGMVYLFTALGAFGTIAAELKAIKENK